MRHIVFAAVLFTLFGLVLFGLTLPMWGQSPTATVNGLVRDPPAPSFRERRFSSSMSRRIRSTRRGRTGRASTRCLTCLGDVPHPGVEGWV